MANKFQTGFDQPLLHTMYVDKKLGGVNAVQTLSRLNRIHPRKSGTLVLDFANEADDIRKAFDPYYEATLLSEATDPNLLYTLQTQLTGFGVFTQGDLDAYARAWFDQSASMDRLYAALGPTKDRVEALSKEERHDFRDRLTDFIRLYAFLAQILTFADVDLEKLYLFGRGLRRLLREERETLPVEVQQNIDMESYRIQQTAAGQIKLKRGSGTLDPAGPPPDHGLAPEDLEPLSRIIAELNERFGLSLGPEHRVTLGQIMGRLDEDTALDAAARVNTRENVRLSFDQKVENAIQDIVDINFTLYKRITDDRAFGEAIKNLLFDQYLRAHRNAEDLIKRSASKSLEFVPALRGIDGKSTDMVLRCIAAFLNTEGGDLLVGVTPDRRVVGMESDQFESDDAVVRYLEQSVRDRLGEAAVARIEPRIQIVNGRMVCVIGCARSSEPVFYRATASGSGGDFYIRTGSRTLKLAPESVTEYSATRFSAKDDPAG
ncbi:MAG: putative DNA binding domain-containing protein [Spirochaetes bacterium]|nr:putative DNA binding domain-containing protein [Spirochaetota bacterium]